MENARIKKIAVVALAVITAFAFTFGFVLQSATATSATPSQKAAKAASWAITQANTYGVCMGTGEKAKRSGCAVCGTSARKKGAKFKNTYCCNPFVQAAFAHGAKSKIMGDSCRKGNCGPQTKKDFQEHKCFKVYSGKNKPSQEKLKKGDVLIWKASCNIYVGNNQYVSVTPGWDRKDADGNIVDMSSISIVNLSKEKYKSTQAVARYNGK